MQAKKQSTSFIIASFVITLIGMIWIFHALTTLGKIYAPISAKDKTAGVITNSYTQEINGEKKYIVDYQYVINNLMYKEKSFVNKNYKKSVGDRIDVYYKIGYESDSVIVGYNVMPYIIMSIFGFLMFSVGVALISSFTGFNDNMIHYKTKPNNNIDLANNKAWKEKISNTKAQEDERNKMWRNALENKEFNTNKLK